MRARIDVLSEMPERVAGTRLAPLGRDRTAGTSRRSTGEPAPDAQRRVPALPDARRRLADRRAGLAGRASFAGAHRRLHGEGDEEAKVHTSWINPTRRTTQAVRGVRRGLLADGPRVPRRRSRPFQRAGRRRCGRLNALAQVLLKLASPGVPDLYQGTELWDLSLVDPDNRRPVDFARAARACWRRC